MRENTIFRMASLTKPIVSAAALALVAKRLLALDEPITHLAAQLPTPHQIRQATRYLRSAPTHSHGRSGLRLRRVPDLFLDLGIGNGLDRPGLGFNDQLARLAEVPLRFRPWPRLGLLSRHRRVGRGHCRGSNGGPPDVVKAANDLTAENEGYDVLAEEMLTPWRSPTLC